MMSRFAEELADRLRNVSGTELVRVYGNAQEEITVTVEPEALTSVGLTIQQVSALIDAADPKLPAGVIHTDIQNIRVQVANELNSLDVVRNIPLVNRGGEYLRLGDIATISRGWQEPRRDMTMVNGEEVVIVGARMQTIVRVDKWTNNAKAVVEGFNQQYAGTVQGEITFEQNLYTEARLSELTNNLFMGCIAVMLVILVFMGFRAALIVGLALPLCVAFALFSLSFYNEQIHQMSIFGIIIAIGLLIDNAIVITDEIRINLQNSALTRIQALMKSVRHLFSPLLASTLTTILGFMPIFLLNGNIGDFIGPIAISVVMALIGSLAISLTVIAALAARFLPRHDDKDTAWYWRGIRADGFTLWFKAMLGKGIKRPIPVLLLCMALPVAGFMLAGRLAMYSFRQQTVINSKSTYGRLEQCYQSNPGYGQVDG